MKLDLMNIVTKYIVTATAVTVPALPSAELSVTVGFIGVPVNVLVACAAGAYASFSWGDPVAPRGKMFNLWVACVIMGATFTGLITFLLEHFLNASMSEGALAGMGGVVSWSTKFWLPWLADALKSGSWVRFIPFLNSKKDGE